MIVWFGPRQLMSCPSETDASRWSEALAPPAEGAAGEAVYAGWDCPQVAALYAYRAAQPDELPLTEGDIVNVTRKTSEGTPRHTGVLLLKRDLAPTKQSRDKREN